MQGRVLLIDDAEDDQQLIKSILGGQHSLEIAGNLAEAEKRLREKQIDLILLDVMLPDGNGFQYCATLKSNDKTREIPVLFLTSKADIPDKVMGFALGAEDYVAKPFHAAELRARVEARLKKQLERKTSEMVVTKGDLVLNVSLQRVFVRKKDGEVQIDLTPLEFKLLLYFAQHEEHVFTRDQLIDAVWGRSVHVLDRTVDMHISNLRKKLAPSVFTLKAIHGVGYRFTREKN